MDINTESKVGGITPPASTEGGNPLFPQPAAAPDSDAANRVITADKDVLGQAADVVNDMPSAKAPEAVKPLNPEGILGSTFGTPGVPEAKATTEQMGAEKAAAQPTTQATAEKSNPWWKPGWLKSPIQATTVTAPGAEAGKNMYGLNDIDAAKVAAARSETGNIPAASQHLVKEDGTLGTPEMTIPGSTTGAITEEPSAAPALDLSLGAETETPSALVPGAAVPAVETLAPQASESTFATTESPAPALGISTVSETPSAEEPAAVSPELPAFGDIKTDAPEPITPAAAGPENPFANASSTPSEAAEPSLPQPTTEEPATVTGSAAEEVKDEIIEPEAHPTEELPAPSIPEYHPPTAEEPRDPVYPAAEPTASWPKSGTLESVTVPPTADSAEPIADVAPKTDFPAYEATPSTEDTATAGMTRGSDSLTGAPLALETHEEPSDKPAEKSPWEVSPTASLEPDAGPAVPATSTAELGASAWGGTSAVPVEDATSVTNTEALAPVVEPVGGNTLGGQTESTATSPTDLPGNVSEIRPGVAEVQSSEQFAAAQSGIEPSVVEVPSEPVAVADVSAEPDPGTGTPPATPLAA